MKKFILLTILLVANTVFGTMYLENTIVKDNLGFKYLTSNPTVTASGFGKLFSRSDNVLYWIDDEGTVTSVVGGGTGGITTYDTVILAEAAGGSADAIIFIVDVDTFYRYEVTGAAYADDNTFVLSTGDGGDTRWLAVAGQYILGDVNLGNDITITNDATVGNNLSVLGLISGDGSSITNIPLDNLSDVNAITNVATASILMNSGTSWVVSNVYKGIDSLSGMSVDQHALTVDVSGGEVYLEVEKTGTGNMLYYLMNTTTGLVNRYELDCTTGAGTGGKARIILTQGSASAPQTNYSYITVSSDPVTVGGIGVATLNASTTLPSGNFAWVGHGAIGDDTFTTSDGAWVFQRYDDATVRNTRGADSNLREKIRANGATYQSGIALTLNHNAGATPDELPFQLSSGKVYQLHLQDFPLFTSPTSFYVANYDDVATPTNFSQFDDLYDVEEEYDGDSLRGKRYNLILWGAVGSGTANKIFVNVPTGTYTNNTLAINDRDSTAVTSVPAAFSQVAFLIARITLRHRTVGGGTIEVLNVVDLRGTPVGASAAGNTGSGSEFEDTVFRIFDGVDSTKELSFQVDGVTTGNLRELTVQDTDGTIALTDTVQTFTGTQTFTNTVTVTGTVAATTFTGDGSQLTGISTSSSLEGLTDVTLTATTTNDLLSFNGSVWVNTDSPTLASFTLSGNTFSTVTTGAGNNGTIPTLGYLDDYLFPLSGGTITGGTTISSTFAVTGNTNLSSTLSVTGDTTLEDVTINATLSMPNLLTSTATRSGYLYVDDNGEINKTPTLNVETSTSKSIIWTGQNGYGSTNQMIQNFSAEVKNDATELVTAVYTDGTNGASITALKRVVTSCSYSGATASGNQFIGCSLNSSQLSTDIRSITAADRISVGLVTGDENGVPCDVILEIGDVLRPHTNRNAQLDTSTMVCTFTGLSEGVVHSGDYGSQLIRYDGYTSRDGSGFVKFKTEQFNNTDLGEYLSVDNTTYTKYIATKPCDYVVSAGAKYTAGGVDAMVEHRDSLDALVQENAMRYINTSHAGNVVMTGRMAIGDYILIDSDTTFSDQASGTYFTIEARPSNIATVIITPITQTAYIKDVKAYNVQGGAATAATHITRDLNTVTGDMGIISLSANQITLSAGKYTIEIYTPLVSTGYSLLYLRDTSTGTNDVYGGIASNEFINSATDYSRGIRATGEIDISTVKTFEVKNYTELGKATYGLGLVSNLAGYNSVYTQVKITKLFGDN